MLEGRHVRLRPVDPTADAEALYAESHPPAGDPGMWTYLFAGPYADAAALREALAADARSADPLVLTLVTLPDEHPAGIASYMRIKPEHGVIEIGGIWFGVSLRQSTAAAEAIYLLAANGSECRPPADASKASMRSTSSACGAGSSPRPSESRTT